MRKYIPAMAVAMMIAGFAGALSLTQLTFKDADEIGLKHLVSVVNSNSALTEAAAAAISNNNGASLTNIPLTALTGGLASKTVTIINGAGTGTNVVLTFSHGVCTAATP